MMMMRDVQQQCDGAFAADKDRMTWIGEEGGREDKSIHNCGEEGGDVRE